MPIVRAKVRRVVTPRKETMYKIDLGIEREVEWRTRRKEPSGQPVPAERVDLLAKGMKDLGLNNRYG